MKRMKLSILVFFSAILMLFLALSVSAAITVDKTGNVIGLDPSVTYDYAKVTMINQASPSYTRLSAGATKIEGLEPGLWFIYNANTATKTAVWIPGDSDNRTDIGDVYYSTSAKKDVVRCQNTTNWMEGVWTGNGAYNNASFAKYYISDLGGNHLTAGDAQKIEAGTMSRTALRTKLQKIVYKYAYTSDEIIPVEELYSISFNVGVRQGSLQLEYSDTATDPDPKTKYVLYTINESGKLETHTTSCPTVYQLPSSKTNHVISVKESFPNAKGWVVGIEIYPFGDLPLSGLKFTQSGDRYINTIFFIEYVPGGYTTKHKSGTVATPFQYNGANSSYIQGYGDGTFAPDADITVAEISTLLARVFCKSNEVPRTIDSSFSDVSLGDWYYNEVTYIEYLQGFKHIDSARLNPERAITRGELAQILYSVIIPDKTEGTAFKDVDSTNPYYEAICSLEVLNIINGYEDGTFRPYATISRAEAVTMINRLINLKANEKTVVKSSLKNNFSDIEGHWAEYDILMAANDNVKSQNHLKASASGLLDTGNTIQLETDYIKIVINKSNGKVTSIINKYDNTDILAISSTPWFTSLASSSGLIFTPKEVSIVDNRLFVKYTNDICAYFIIDVKNDYFTVEIDSELPLSVANIRFGSLSVNTPFSDEDEESYRLSGVMMNYNTNSSSYPGGASKNTNATVMRKFGGMGGKIAIAFSKFGGKVEGKHRAILKDIVNAMDPEIAAVSRKGGAFTVEHTDVYGDYVILSSGFTATTAKETAQVMKKYSIDQLDMHQGGSTFIQGEFNFVCAKKGNETFTTAKQFSERVGYLATEEGVQLGLHTYSSLVPTNATTILKNPKWQKQICYDEENVLTLKNDVTASVRVFPTNEDASGLTLAASNIQWSGPATRYYLIDEEIVLVSAFDSTGLTTVTRGQCGTTAAAHKAGAEIRQLQCWYSMFQSIPGSELFYHIADLTAEAYNDGGFEMIYLDGLESFGHFVSSSEAWYYYASFIHRVVSGCKNDPIIEGSAFPLGFWTSRARGGAWDHAHRDYKGFNKSHLNSNKTLLNYYCTATLGWFHYSPDMGDSYKNMSVKTVFRDDLDHMGSLCVAYDMTTVLQPFSVSNFKTYKSLADNFMYFNLYSRLRKGGYFSPSVKKSLRLGISEGKEYKLEEMADGTWAFREMKYFKNRILDMVDSTYAKGAATNPFNAQTPYVRIEQRYSTLGNNEQVICEFDETAQVVATTATTVATGSSSRRGYKIKVFGNNSTTDAIMLSLNNNLNFCIPLNFSGWREFILMDADNAENYGYTFSGENKYQRGTHDYNITSVKVILSGTCKGVMIDDLRAVEIINTPAINPSVTIGGNTLTFNTTLRSGEYVEYFPELGKAYQHSYAVNTNGTNGVAMTVKEITFSGAVTVPEGNFEYTYNGTSENDATLRAQVVIGVKSSDVIANEDSWTAPSVELTEDIQWTTLK